MEYSGDEKRKDPRVEGTFVVSYRIHEELDKSDLSQTKNISEGGMLLTTNRAFKPGVLLSMHIRLPFVEERIDLIGRVLESNEIVSDLIYETRILFLEIDGETRKALENTVDFYRKKP